jgi:HK97 family phage major capsid protein
MITAKTLRAERAKLVEDARAVIGSDNPTAEDFAKFDEMMGKVDQIKAQIDRIEKSDAINAEMSEVIGERAEKAGISVIQQEDEVAREKRVIRGLLSGGVRALKDSDREYAVSRINNTALNTGTNSQGGYTVAPLFFNELQIAMKQQGGMRQASRVITTQTGASLPFATMDDTANAASIISENTQITEDTEVSFGQKTLGAYTYKSGVLLISLQLLNDAAFDFDNLLRDAIVSRFVRGTNAHYTTGTGSSQPTGAVTAANSGGLTVTGATGQTSSVILDDLLDMIHKVDPVYRRGASWMLHDSSVKVIRKLKDSQGHPLWQPSLVAGAPDTLLNYNVVVNMDMPRCVISYCKASLPLTGQG